MIRRRGRTGVALLALAGTMAAAGCRHDSTGGYSGPYARQVAEAIPKIERAVGVPFKHPPKVETRTKEQVRAFLLKQLEDSVASHELDEQQRAYKRLGMIPDSLDLRKLLVDLLTEQVAGFYDPATKTLYIVKGGDAAMVGVTVTHELVHALQDQYLNLDSLEHVHGDNDRTMAVQAVLEGQATFEHIRITAGPGLDLSRLPSLWDQARQQIRESQSSMPVFARAPLAIQETLIFPYLSGAEFMRRFHSRRPDQVPWSDLPTSTEQILHEDAYFGTPRDTTTRVTLPAPAQGARVAYDDDLGEFETRLLLYQLLHDQNAAIRAATGWDGDRYAILDTPRGEGLAWVSVWDTPVDAAEFAEQLGDAVPHRYAGIVARGGADHERRFEGAGRTVLVRGADVGGRSLVLYVDVPAGVDPSVIDLRQVRLAPER